MQAAERNATRIFRHLVRKDKDVSRSREVRSFQPGDTVCEAEEMARALCLVLRGRVQILRRAHSGRSFVTATVGPGSMLGEQSLLGGQKPGTLAVALEPCTVWLFSAHRAREICAANPMFGFGLMQAIGQRVKEAEDRLEDMAYRNVPSRLAALLLELGGDDPGLVVRATHHELADMLGTWRETISKTLQDFRSKGWVTSGRRRVILLDTESLQKVAES